MASNAKLSQLNDVEILEWIFNQGHVWVDTVWDISNSKTLQDMVDFVKTNYSKIKEIERA